jgi:acetyl-CoA synthetase
MYQEILSLNISATEKWQKLTQAFALNRPSFDIQKQLYQMLAQESQREDSFPAYVPTQAQIDQTNISRLGGYDALYQASLHNPESYWRMILAELGIHGKTEFKEVLSGSAQDPKWLAGMRYHCVWSCFEHRDLSQIAIKSAKESNPTQIDQMTLGELKSKSIEVALALRSLGLKKGDAWAIDMPMTVQSVYIYLGIILAGGVVVSIADSFAPVEIQTRLEIAKAKGVFTQDFIFRGGKYLPLYQKVVESQAQKIITIPADQSLKLELRAEDLSWDGFIALAQQEQIESFAPAFTDAQEIINILFSSGTTGQPKAIPWTQLTPIKAAADGLIHQDIQKGQIIAWPTNLGWMMGPWLIFATLLNHGTIALYEGNPGHRDFLRFIDEAQVNMLGIVPSLVKAWRSVNAFEGLAFKHLRAFSSTGEASSPDDYFWLMAQVNYQPVIEYCGGTEIGGGYITGTLVQPQIPSAFSTPAFGTKFYLLDDEGKSNDQVGEIALVAPMLGSSQTLLNADHHKVYFEGMPLGPNGEVLRRHGDQIAALGGGYYRAQGRVDDAMNLGGIKVSSAEIERVCLKGNGIEDIAAIAYDPPMGGPSELILAIVPKNEGPKIEELQQLIRTQLNPLFKIQALWLVSALPRTASNKVMRRVLRKQYLELKTEGEKK